ncbi:hypothetical protein GQ44DRAFT_765907 [Phaeosphaeriaceae sp. PMI808]|nr:hypothetical protein GQ44DRAFT_765907 [Phaeosphaeriaceae sp. PMI808]
MPHLYAASALLLLLLPYGPTVPVAQNLAILESPPLPVLNAPTPSSTVTAPTTSDGLAPIDLVALVGPVPPEIPETAPKAPKASDLAGGALTHGDWPALYPWDDEDKRQLSADFVLDATFTNYLPIIIDILEDTIKILENTDARTLPYFLPDDSPVEDLIVPRGSSLRARQLVPALGAALPPVALPLKPTPPVVIPILGASVPNLNCGLPQVLAVPTPTIAIPKLELPSILPVLDVVQPLIDVAVIEPATEVTALVPKSVAPTVLTPTIGAITPFLNVIAPVVDAAPVLDVVAPLLSDVPVLDAVEPILSVTAPDPSLVDAFTLVLSTIAPIVDPEPILGDLQPVLDIVTAPVVDAFTSIVDADAPLLSAVSLAEESIEPVLSVVTSATVLVAPDLPLPPFLPLIPGLPALGGLFPPLALPPAPHLPPFPSLPVGPGLVDAVAGGLPAALPDSSVSALPALDLPPALGILPALGAPPLSDILPPPVIVAPVIAATKPITGIARPPLLQQVIRQILRLIAKILGITLGLSNSPRESPISHKIRLFIKKWHTVGASLSDASPKLVQGLVDYFVNPSSPPTNAPQLEGFPEADRMDIVKLMFDGTSLNLGEKNKRSMRYGSRQGEDGLPDAGIQFDDAEKLGKEALTLLGLHGSLDPLGLLDLIVRPGSARFSGVSDPSAETAPTKEVATRPSVETIIEPSKATSVAPIAKPSRNNIEKLSNDPFEVLSSNIDKQSIVESVDEDLPTRIDWTEWDPVSGEFMGDAEDLVDNLYGIADIIDAHADEFANAPVSNGELEHAKVTKLMNTGMMRILNFR